MAELDKRGMRRIALALGYSGSYLAARDLFRRITTAHEQDSAYGPGHPNTLTARHELAFLTGEVGDAAAARDQTAARCPSASASRAPSTPTP